MKMPRSSPWMSGCTTYTPAMTSDSWTSANGSLLGEVESRVDRSTTQLRGHCRPGAPAQPQRGRCHHDQLEQLRDGLRRRALTGTLPQRERVEPPRLMEPAAVEVVGGRLGDRDDGRARTVGD